MRRLEAALLHAYESHAAITLVEPADPSQLGERAPPTDPADTAREVDDDRPTPVTFTAPASDSTPEVLERYARCQREGDLDGQVTTAAVLVRRGVATPEQHALFERFRAKGPPRPARALTSEAWARLFHPDEDRTTGDVFAVIASAALLGRISAMRRDRSLPHLDPEKRHEHTSSTVSAVRAVAWSAATLGMRAPPVYVDPSEPLAFEIVPALPPALRLGAPMLSGLSAVQLAFHCARHVTWFREEHFVCTLVPTIANLEELFLAALSIGAPQIPLLPEVRARLAVVAEAILPVLDEAKLARLNRQVAAFVTAGGRTSLRKWAQSAEWTALRAGVLLCGDLQVACDVVAKESNAADRIRELERFWASDDATYLRAQLGIGVTT